MINERLSQSSLSPLSVLSQSPLYPQGTEGSLNEGFVAVKKSPIKTYTGVKVTLATRLTTWPFVRDNGLKEK